MSSSRFRNKNREKSGADDRDASRGGFSNLKPSKPKEKDDVGPVSLKNTPKRKREGSDKNAAGNWEMTSPDGFRQADAEVRSNGVPDPESVRSYAESKKYAKAEKLARKDFKTLSSDYWLARNGHTLTYIGLFAFSILVLFRPYEILPSLSFLSATAFYFAVFTLALYVPTQLLTEGNLTTLPLEVKAILAMTLVALLTILFAKDRATAWEEFNDIFIKAVLMFIVMVNVLRSRARLMGMIWLSLLAGVLLSYIGLGMYMRGELNTEGYRVMVEVGGMFGNPNYLAMHLVMMTPLAVTLGIAARSKLAKLVYFGMAGLFVAANTITYSRGGFLGLIAAAGVLVWKLGRRSRAKVSIAALISGFFFLLLAPGQYGVRMLSIFVPALDPVGSSNQRQDLLIRSIIVTLRNPWGIGIGNSPLIGYRNLGTHNSYTQVSSELGIAGLVAYLVFVFGPLRKLRAIERTLFSNDQFDWFYYLSIGLQASIVGYVVSSFFGAVAYNWFIYYLVAYAVAFRRIYGLSQKAES